MPCRQPSRSLCQGQSALSGGCLLRVSSSALSAGKGLGLSETSLATSFNAMNYCWRWLLPCLLVPYRR